MKHYLLFLMAFVSLGLTAAQAQSSIPELNLEMLIDIQYYQL